MGKSQKRLTQTNVYWTGDSMKIASFSATGVHGHLDLSINFRPDYTFVIGLNGSGKTSALRITMALLTPNLADLVALSFDTASIHIVEESGTNRAISAVRTSEELTVCVDGLDEPLVLTAAEQALLAQRRNPDEGPSPVLVKALDHEVSKFILDLGTPMFLGLDRRFVGDVFSLDPAEVRRREFFQRRLFNQDVAITSGNVAAGLRDVNVLVQETMSEIRQQQEELDSEFRNRLLASAFRFEPVAVGAIQPPSRAAIRSYLEKRNEIEAAIRNLQIPISDFRVALDNFFSSMNQIAEDLEQPHAATPQSRITEAQSSKKRGRRFGVHAPPSHPPVHSEIENKKIVEWIINKPQVDRITTHLELLTTYNARRAKLREPIDRYLKLLNSFLSDTGKRVLVNERGVLEVEINNEPRPVGYLSSGERQLVVMLGHLALNKRLAGSGVFVVDEPELSLHISWQERFVDAVREANPTVQMVLATHSPAIILNRDEHCESLDARAEGV